jgi:xanthine/uracil permease
MASPKRKSAAKASRHREERAVFGWTPGIGDPTVYGWVTVVAYAIGAYACWLAWTRSPARERNTWLVLTLIMAFLCINKQLDLQELFTDVGRAEAKEHGWYAVRHTYQVAFIAALTLASIVALTMLIARTRRASGALRGAIVGLALLLLFVLVRASSFHKVDWFINLHLAGVRANHVLELGGIAIVTAFAMSASKKPRSRRAT